VKNAILSHDKTITLSVGQLTTGVTIPEWTAVLMLSNMSSPALYMQAAFRAQNPCLFRSKDDNFYRKTNAYVFDFDPARTLKIYEKFANDLIPETYFDKYDFDERKQHVRELLNFFPVFGEDDSGSMVELDAESVLSIPRRIHAKEVVERGFMSNFLFANISGIFGAPKEIIDMINNMQPIGESKSLKSTGVDEDTAKNLSLNDSGEVDIPNEQIIGTAADIFGEKIYIDIDERLDDAVTEILKLHEKNPDPEKEEIKYLREKFSNPISDTLIDAARRQYGADLKKSTQNRLENKIHETCDSIVTREYGYYTIKNNQLEKEKNEKIAEAQKSGESMAYITDIEKDYDKRKEENHRQMVDNIRKELNGRENVKKTAETIVKTVETEQKTAEKEKIEGNVRDHLRGFSRTIPAFLMAYGDENTTLENFDSLVPSDVFFEVTVNPQNGEGVTLDDFRLLRDGGDYVTESGEKKHFDGHLFDEVVFNDAVKEFIKKRNELSDYFSGIHKDDIFAYIPPQRTNQIFTPKKVVKEMVDMLEKENPGCFDNPDSTFADLYMKSGMYITEIVTRLFQSEKMKSLFPDDSERLNHIFSKQVYGCAPTEIIYRICLRYILGFSGKIRIEKNNIRLCDTLEYAKNGNLKEEMEKLFGIEPQ